MKDRVLRPRLVQDAVSPDAYGQLAFAMPSS